MSFLNDLVKALRPDKGTWYLEKYNTNSLVNAWHLKYLCYIKPEMFIFDFGKRSTVAWKLAVPSAVDALYICRLDPNFDEYNIACCLVQQGICFQMLLPLRDIPRSPDSNHPQGIHMLPIHISGYQFTLKDYEAYHRQCHAILAQPRAHAALLQGGIIWRLALEFISFDDALRGPSIATMVHRYRLVVNYRKDDILGDDSLTE